MKGSRIDSEEGEMMLVVSGEKLRVLVFRDYERPFLLVLSLGDNNYMPSIN